MLPGTAMRDIMMHNVMAPFANLFRTRNNVHAHRREDVEKQDNAGGWSREKRRQWWRSLGQLSSPNSSRPRSSRRVVTMPVDQYHVAKSRQKRTVVGLYSYAPWLTNDVNILHSTQSSNIFLWNLADSLWVGQWPQPEWQTHNSQGHGPDRVRHLCQVCSQRSQPLLCSYRQVRTKPPQCLKC